MLNSKALITYKNLASELSVKMDIIIQPLLLWIYFFFSFIGFFFLPVKRKFLLLHRLAVKFYSFDLLVSFLFSREIQSLNVHLLKNNLFSIMSSVFILAAYNFSLYQLIAVFFFFLLFFILATIIS